MNAAYEKLIQHLDTRNIGYQSRGEDRSICADFRGEFGTYRVIAKVDEDDSLFQVFGYSPVRVPIGSRPAVAETVVRANYGLKVGKFEMDYDEGDLRFQAAQILPDDNLEDQTIHRLMGTTINVLNIYLPAILSVIYGNELPKAAISHAEPRRCGVDRSEGGERSANE
ncbi:MAG: YbjN domain-containing protein [Candidatus Sulfotelmatobacter sp.]